jgi:hypothetical protein
MKGQVERFASHIFITIYVNWLKFLYLCDLIMARVITADLAAI